MKGCSMPIHICCACGTSYPDAAEPPARCLICEDERQFVPRGGQVWTTPEKLAGGDVNAWGEMEGELVGIHTHSQFGIGQAALLFASTQSNCLLDWIKLLGYADVLLIGGL